jgi:flagellar FliJ protein
MRFRFPYEKLLAHKKTLEELARKEYLIARALVEDAERELKDMYDVVTNSRQRVSRLELEGGTQGPSLMQIHEFITGQKVRIERQREKIRALLAEAERKHGALIEAAREHKTLEKLKERRFEEFKQLLKKQDLKVIDEIVTTRFKKEES